MATLPPDIKRILEEQGLLEPEDPSGGADQALQDLRELGLLPPEEGADVFQPVRTFFGATQGSLAQPIASALAPTQLAAARAELEKGMGVSPTSPWYEKVEASPGVGDIGAQFVPQSVRDSRLGTALGPFARVAGNILGDPTTYTPFVLGRLTGVAAKGVPAGAALIREGAQAELARKAALGAAPLAEGVLGPGLSEGAAQAARLAEGRKIAQTVMAEGSPLQRAVYAGGSALRGAEPIATGAAAALAYGPGVARGALEGWEQVAEGITEQPLADTGAEAVNASLQSGLAALMALGLISAAKAQATWLKHLQDQRPADVEARVAGVGEEVAGAVDRLETPPEAPPEAVPEAPLPPGEELPGFAPEGPPPKFPEEGPPLRFPEEPEFAPAFPDAPALRAEPEAPPSKLEAAPEVRARESEIESALPAPQPRVTEEKIEAIPEPPPAKEPPSAQPAEAIAAPVGRAEPQPAPAPRAEPPPPASRAEPVKSALEGPVKAPLDTDVAREATPEYVEGLWKKVDDELAGNEEVGRLLRSVHGLGKEKRSKTPAYLEKQAQVADLFGDPERRKKLVATIKRLQKEKGEEFDLNALRATIFREAKSGEGSITRKVDAGAIIERAPAEAPAPVGKVEAPPKKIANHYDFIKDQIERKGSELQTAGIKSVGELVEQLPLSERFKPQEVQAYRDYVKARDAGQTHAQAIEAVRNAQKGRWSTDQAAANAVNLILREARQLNLKKGTVKEVETGKQEATPEVLETLAREKQEILGHLREGVRGGNLDNIEASIGAWLAHVKKRDLYDLKRDYKFLSDMKKLADEVNADERFKGPQVSAAARKNATQLGEAIARRVGVVVKAAEAKAKAALGVEGKKQLAALKGKQEAPPQAEAAPAAAPIKRTAAPGTIPPGPGGFRALPSHPRRPGSWYEGPNGTKVTKAGGIVRVEESLKADGTPLSPIEISEDLARLRADPDVKAIDADLPPRALDSVLLVDENQLPHFIEDPDPPKLSEGYERFVRLGWKQARIAKMEARDAGVPPSWATPLSRQNEKPLHADEWAFDVKLAAEDKIVASRLRVELAKQGVTGLDLNTPIEEIGRGTFHMVFNVPGAKDAQGRDVVMRVGKSPFFQLKDPAARALVQETLAKGQLAEHNAEPLFYTIHPKGMVASSGLVQFPVGKIDETGKLTTSLQTRVDPRVEDVPTELPLQLAVEEATERAGVFPPGRSLQEFLDDVGLLLWKAANAGLDISHDVIGYTKNASNYGAPKGLRGDQFAYVPVKSLDTQGVGYTDPAGKHWQLVAVDFGTLTPGRGEWANDPVMSQIHESRRIALSSTLPKNRLTLEEDMRQTQHYDEDGRDAEPIGDEVFSANHDRIASQEFVDRHGELGASAAAALRGIVDDLTSTINSRADMPAEGKINVVYRGLTSSPHLAGLYHERLGTDETAHIYTNLVEAVANSRGNYERVVDDILGPVIHEVTHNKNKGHEASFQTFEEYVRNVLDMEGKLDSYREQLRAAMPEEQFRSIERELVPEFLRMRRAHGNAEGRASWRDAVAREGSEGAASRDAADAAASRAETLPDRLGGGEEGAAAGRLRGAQPGGAVPRGDQGPTGGVRPAAASDGLAAARSAEAEAARSAAGGDPLKEISERIAAYGTRVPTEEGAKQLLTELIDLNKKIGSPMGVEEIHKKGWALAGDLVKILHPKDVEARAKSLPDPRGKIDLMKGAINMLHYVDLPNEIKARFQIWWELTKGHWPADTPQRWETVDAEVREMLGLHTPEQWAYHFRNKGGGPTARDLLLMREVSNQLAGKVVDAEKRLYDALADKTSTPELITKLQDDVNRANEGAIRGGVMMAEGGTKAGRALAILRKDIREANPQIAFEQNLRAALRERTQSRFRGDPKKAEALANELFNKFMEIRNSPNPDWSEFQKAYRAMLGSKLWPEKILEFYKGGLLSWPSRVANMTSNALLRGVRLVEDAVAAGLDAAGSKLTGKERELFVGEGTVAMLALRRAWGQAFPEWMQEMMRNVTLQSDDFAKSVAKGSMMEDLLQHGGAIEGKLGEFIRFHLKGMGADDAFAKQFVRIDNLYRQVYRKIRKGDKSPYFQKRAGESTPQAVERIVSELYTNWVDARDGAPQSDYAKVKAFTPMMLEAEKAARRETFQEELKGGFQSGQTMLRNNPIMQIFIPFYRTPINITKEMLVRTPLGFFNTMKKWQDLSPLERAQELSRNTTGSLLGLGALAYAMSGGATGGGPLDPDERSMLESTGWQPYSVKLGDNYVSYQRLEPIASILGIAADTAEGIRNGDFQSVKTGAVRVMQSAGENVTNKTFLSGLDALTSAISHPNQFMGTFIKRMQSSVVPNSLGFVPVSGLARSIDMTYRQTEPLTMGAFYSKLPFLSSTLEPQYSPSGAERKRPGTPFEQIVSPFARTKMMESGPARLGAEEVVRLAASPKAPRKYWVAPGGLRVDFLPDERKAMAQAMEAATKYIGERLIKDPNYLALPENELDPRFRFGAKTKETVIKNVYGRYRDQVMQRIKPRLAARGRKQLQERD